MNSTLLSLPQLQSTNGSGHIFVSYTMRDHVVRSEMLADLSAMLAPLGSVFVHCLHNDSHNSQERVIQELCSASGLVLVHTPSIMESPWVRLELRLAWMLGIPVIGIYRPLIETYETCFSVSGLRLVDPDYLPSIHDI